MSTNPRETRSLPVPEGLAGMRVDAALAKLLGLSRTVAANLSADGDVLVDGTAVGKSERLHEGAWLEVTLPEPAKPLVPKEELVEGMDILYFDDDLIAVHKPVGRPHCSGWSGCGWIPHLDVWPAGAQGHCAAPRRRYFGGDGGGGFGAWL